MNNRILKIISYLLVAASFIFIFRALMGLNIDQIRTILTVRLLIILFILSFIYSLCSIFYALAWKKLLFIFSGQEIPDKKVINLYLKSNIAKYLPGNVFHFAGRHILVKEDNISHTHLMLSNLSEIFLLVFTSVIIIAAGLVLRLIVIPEKIVSLISLKYVFIAFAVFAIVSSAVLSVLIVKKQYRRIMTILKMINLRNLREIFFTVVLYSTMFVITGSILFIIFYMLKPDNFSFNFIYQIIFVFTLSWVLGYIVPGAPGGVGIREAVIIIMLAPVSDPQTSALGALILRVVTIIGDIFSFFISNHSYFNQTDAKGKHNE